MINSSNYKITLLLLLVAVHVSGCSKSKYPVVDIKTPPVDTVVIVKPVINTYALLADSVQAATYSTFLSADKNYYLQNNTGNTTFNYWPQAHVLDVLLDAFLRTKDVQYSTRMKALLTGIKIKNGGAYPNEFYDDMGWLANASVRSYNATGDAGYLNVAQILYAEIKGAVNTNGTGGVAWQRSQLYYKNTPSTGNAIILAAKLYQLQGNAADLALAKSLYNWLKTTLVNPKGIVYDGINRNKDNAIDYWDFTYNQGLYIGSALELYNCTKDAAYLQDAVLTANNLITDPNLLSNGILKDEGQGDGGLFKGVAVRYLAALTGLKALNETSRGKYALFLQKNIQAIEWHGLARPSLMIGSNWAVQPPAKTDLTTQLSGLIMIEAAAKLKTDLYSK